MLESIDGALEQARIITVRLIGAIELGFSRGAIFVHEEGKSSGQGHIYVHPLLNRAVEVRRLDIDRA